MSQKPTDAAARRALLLNLSPWLFFVGLIVLWELVCRIFELPTYVLPAPSEIGKAFFDVEFSRWMMHLWATLRVALMERDSYIEILMKFNEQWQTHGSAELGNTAEDFSRRAEQIHRQTRSHR